MDHTNVEVGDAWKGHGRVVVKPAEVWAGSGGKQTGQDSMQTDRVCTIDMERTEGKRTRSVWKVNPVGR